MFTTERFLYKSFRDGRFEPVVASGPYGTVFVNPDNSNHIVLSGEPIKVSTNGGIIWEDIQTPGTVIGRGSMDWGAQRLLVPILDPDGGTLYSLSTERFWQP